jgi:hypothetical protein
MGSSAVFLLPSALDTPAGELPLAVWPCANTSPQHQQAGRYRVVTVDQYPSSFHARRAFTALATHTGPGEEDATITPTGPLGAWYGVGLGGRFPGEARDLDQALVMLRKAMDADQVWPDVWFISDHGSAQRLDSGGRD